MRYPDQDRIVVPDPLVGTPYRALFPLAEGGMGELFEAEQLALGKRVVVKLLREALLDDPAMEARLQLEAQVAGRLSHPNLVAVLDYGKTPAERPYLVMEKLNGRTLREELHHRGAFSIEDAVSVLVQTLAGLETVHRAGLVHRDVKLGNLFLCEAEGGHRVVKILDFGVVKVLARRGSMPAPLAIPTGDGCVVGTPRYVAPEQIVGIVDPRGDLYAAGIVLYWLLTGCDPFSHHRDPLALLRAHASEAPEPPSRRMSRPLPEALETAILRALAKQPGDRFPSAAEFSAALQAAILPMARAVSAEAPLSSPNPRCTRSTEPGGPDEATRVLPPHRLEAAPRLPPSLRGLWAMVVAGLLGAVVTLLVLTLVHRRASLP
ncbi:MAG: serine/threonine-protein kinase [Minicystis sp.]